MKAQIVKEIKCMYVLFTLSSLASDMSTKLLGSLEGKDVINLLLQEFL